VRLQNILAVQTKKAIILILGNDDVARTVRPAVKAFSENFPTKVRSRNLLTIYIDRYCKCDPVRTCLFVRV